MSILSRSREYVPDGNEQRRHYRTDDKTAETESGDAAECGNQHKVVPASVSLPTRSGEKSCRLSPSRGHRTPAERRPAKRHRLPAAPTIDNSRVPLKSTAWRCTSVRHKIKERSGSCVLLRRFSWPASPR